MAKRVVELELYLHHETAMAILVSEDEDDDDADKVWLPKSQVEFEDSDAPDMVMVTIPQWLAEKTGLA